MKMIREKIDMWILLIRSPIAELLEYRVKPGVNTLGRRKDNDLYISDDAASRHHADIEYDPEKEKVLLHDLGSKNGTFLNGKKVTEPVFLGHEDQVRIGHYQITVVFEGQVKKEPSLKLIDTASLKDGLMLESIDRNAILLYEITRQLEELPDIQAVIAAASEHLKRMTGADDCWLVLADELDHLDEEELPVFHLKEVYQSQKAALASNFPTGLSSESESGFSSVYSTLCAPILVDDQVFALVYAAKHDIKTRPFDRYDLALVMVIGNQVVLTIKRKKDEALLLHNATHDQLTDLPNRKSFIKCLKGSIEKAKEQDDYFFALLFVDIDNFKLINDSIGHLGGDELLIQIAGRLTQNLFHERLNINIRIVARLAGDEFGVIAEDIRSVDDAVEIANLIQGQILTPFVIEEREVFTSASIGIALGTTGYHQPEDMLRDADIAMFRAKELGRARHTVFNKVLHDRLIDRLNLQTSLRQAADQNEFRLHYQPIISLEAGRLVGFEALLRWQVSEKEILYPNEFFSSLDTTGLLSMIDSWVLREACLQLKAWQNDFPMEPPLFMAINLSGKQVNHPDLVGQIKKVIEESGIDGDHLWVEINEKDSMKNSEATLAMLAELRKLNVHISIDDFGTGFSSMKYLHKFPIDALKIDRSFISSQEGQTDDAIITTIRKMTEYMNILVIAEGVETDEQFKLLQALKCDYAQGFYFSKPVEPSKAVEFIEQDIYW